MKKYAIIVLGLLIILGIVFVVMDKGEAAEAKHFALTAKQKALINNARITGEDLSGKEIDTFTIGQGKFLLDQYFKKHDLHYKVGSDSYIHFLASISESKNLQKRPEFTIIDTYANVYLAGLQEDDPLIFRYHLKQATLDKTVKEIRMMNTK